jgi:hypothetical protein
LSLNKAILQCIENRLQNINTVVLSTEAVNDRLVELIEQNYSDVTQQERAVHLIGQILNDRSVEIIGKTIAFLSTLPSPDVVTSLWMQGFLSESISMHSCNPGALERVVTGLRGINDAELDAIFMQVEAPRLVRTYMTNIFNIFHDDNNAESTRKAKNNAKRLAIELVKKNITTKSCEEDVKIALKLYAIEIVESFHVELKDFESLIEEYILLVLDAFDTHVLSFIETELELQKNNSNCDAVSRDSNNNNNNLNNVHIDNNNLNGNNNNNAFSLNNNF